MQQKQNNNLRKFRAYCVYLCISLFALLSFSSGVSAAQQKRAELVVDVETGKILYNYAAYAKRYPASVTKMMTLYLVFDAIEQGHIAPDTKMLMTRKIKKLGKRNGGITFDGVKVGDTITVKEAIYTLITKSANDVAILVSHTIAGSEKNFAKRMTKMARHLGMLKTNFTNASGLPDRAQHTTARDMAVLGVRLMQKFPQYYKYFSTKTASIKGYKLRNHNHMLKSYKGMDGFKTGYINMSGFNLVGSAERNGKRLIGVVFGGKTSAQRNKRMAKILDLGWKRLEKRQAYKKTIGIAMPYLAALRTNYSPLDDTRKSEVIMTASLVTPQEILRTLPKNNIAYKNLQEMPPTDIVTKPKQEENTVAQPTAQGWNIVAITDTRSGNNSLNIKDSDNNNVTNKTSQHINVASRTVAEIIQAYQAPEKTSEQKQTHHKMVPIVEESDKLRKKEIILSDDSATASVSKTKNKNNVVKNDTVEGKWLLQVGAFSKEKTAHNYMQQLQKKYPKLAKTKTILTPIQNKKDTIFRARFTGLSSSDARNTCTALKSEGKQCIMLSSGI